VGLRRVLTPRWLLVHAAAVVLVIGFMLLCWWQVSRAAAGNLLSFGYALEWPAFAGFVIFVWIREARKAMRGPVAESQESPAVNRAAAPAGPRKPIAARRGRVEAAYDDRDDPELAAYNHYLGWLNANPHKTPAEYPGLPVNQGETT
jgi:DNA-binding transcriptional regulator of glucitol operon